MGFGRPDSAGETANPVHGRFAERLNAVTWVPGSSRGPNREALELELTFSRLSH